MKSRRKRLDWTGPGDLERYGLLALAAVLLLAIAWLAQALAGEPPPFRDSAAVPQVPSSFEDEVPPDAASADIADVAGEVAPVAGRGALASDARSDAPGGGLVVPTRAGPRPDFDFYEPPIRLAGRPAVIAPPPPGARVDARVVTVRRGDTLQKIAARELGAAGRWRVLIDWNPGLDPKRLQTGSELKLPPIVRAAPPAASRTLDPARTHLVAADETLRSIALSWYGDELCFIDLLEANRDLLDQPEELRTGMRLRVPPRSRE